MSASAKALLCLALNAYHEARGEPIQGQVAVSQVVLRRANFEHAKVCREVYRPAQFSWTATHPRPRVRDRKAWEQAVQAARVAMLWGHGAPLRDYSAGADHYHATYVTPSWSRRMRCVAAIGDHEFYKGKP